MCEQKEHFSYTHLDRVVMLSYFFKKEKPNAMFCKVASLQSPSRLAGYSELTPLENTKLRALEYFCPYYKSELMSANPWWVFSFCHVNTFTGNKIRFYITSARIYDILSVIFILMHLPVLRFTY